MALACAAMLAGARPAAAQDKLQEEINKAIDRGVDYVKKLQRDDGMWPHDLKGATTLAAWTLLECGVSPNDPKLQKAADQTRDFILSSNRTYEVALAIMFLDRLGDPEDEPLIEVLALQLMMSQGQLHGWTYAMQPIPDRELNRLRQHYAKLREQGPRKLAENPPAEPPTRDPSKVHADVMQLAQAINKAPLPPVKADDADNSNTQFGMLALWVARRHGMPVDRALQRVELRFRLTQQKKTGGWSYTSDPGAGNQPTAQMTACGLLSLALGNAATPPKFAKDLNKDPAVKAGLIALSTSIGDAGQEREKLVQSNAGKSYYFLWTLERMAVIYGFKTICSKDWYRWGAELLLANQQGDGSWQGEFAGGAVDTCFALLFLKKANVARDLTATFSEKVKDPGKVSDDLLDLIGREVKPGVDKGVKKDPKKNTPQSEVPPSPPGTPRLIESRLDGAAPVAWTESLSRRAAR
jgi:hypothetical protein